MGASGSERSDAGTRHGLRSKLGKLIAWGDARLQDDVQRLQTRLHDRFQGITAFLDRPDIPADNNATERDIRVLARHRGATGGTRSTQPAIRSIRRVDEVCETSFSRVEA